MKRAPADAHQLDVEALFDRWTGELAELEAQVGPPQIDPLVPGDGPGRPVSDEWRAEGRARTDLLFPLAVEMALVYRHRLDAAGRRRAVALLAGHRRVSWQFESVITAWFARCLQSLAQPDLDVTLALIALFDERATGRDFSRSAYPFYLALGKRGLDAAALFLAGLPLAVPHADPDHGAHGFFRKYGGVAE